MSAKGLYAYAHTGFGCITRHFKAKGVLCVTPEMLDELLREQRELFEQKKISVWKWCLIRRSCEILKRCTAEDSVALPPLPRGHLT